MLPGFTIFAAAIAAAPCEVRENSLLLPPPKRPPCVAFQAERRMTGLWIDAFEASSFRAGETSFDPLKRPADYVWLSIAPRARPTLLRREGSGHVYRVTFDGRAARDMHRRRGDGYGHMAMSDGLVIVDRLIAIDDLGCVARSGDRAACTDLPVR